MCNKEISKVVELLLEATGRNTQHTRTVQNLKSHQTHARHSHDHVHGGGVIFILTEALRRRSHASLVRDSAGTLIAVMVSINCKVHLVVHKRATYTTPVQNTTTAVRGPRTLGAGSGRQRGRDKGKARVWRVEELNKGPNTQVGHTRAFG